MSTMSDYYCPDETPIEADPPDYDEAFPIEERMLERVQRMQWLFGGTLLRFAPAIDKEVHEHLASLEGYLKVAIVYRDRPAAHPCDVDAEFLDPFADDERVMERRYGADA